MAEKIVENKDLFASDLVTKTIKDVQGLVNELDKLEKKIVDVAKVQKSVINTEDNKSIQSIKRTNDALTKLNKASEMSETISKNKIKLESRLKIARKDSIQENEELKVLISEQNKINKTLAKEKLGLVSAYEKESKRLNELRKQYKNLAVSEKGSSKEAKALLIQITALDTKLKAVDRTVGQSQRNVGNYTGAFQKLGSTLRTGLGIAGITLGAAAIGRAFKNSFNRIREFDKELNNIAGLTGVTRSELKDVESAIIDVAGSSVRTSNEVAKLAATLFTLGKTKSEVKLLLKPVNDLSIALNASSEDTADFLGQTLNAFGKGAESGQEFADIIANVRTSTSLDFERIKDALGFVAPTANALNLTLGQTSALIGVLQDNGIKSARAGRLLNTSFARLITQGLSLDEALEKINNSQNKIQTSTQLFGAESFTLGLILADNTEKTKEYANEFDNLSEGSLKRLTDEQLKSLDAQLKILDSTWEKFLLNVENGNGIISQGFRGLIVGLTDFIDNLTLANTKYTELIAKVRNEGLSEQAKRDKLEYKAYTEELKKNGVEITNNREAALKFLKVDIERSKSLKKLLSDTGKLTDQQQDEANILNTRIIAILEAAESQDKLNVTQEEGNGITQKTIKQSKELNGIIEKQAKVVSDLNEKIQQARSEEFILKLSLELDVEEEELARLKRIVSSSVEEINAIEIDLIKDQTEKRIAEEEEKSRKLIETIRSNSRTELKVKEELINQEEERLRSFTEDENIKSLKAQIKAESDLAKATFEIKRTGFKTEEEYEEEKAAQFKAIKRNELQAELDLLEFYGREEDKLRREQLKAEIQGLNEFGKQAERLTIEALEVIAELVDEGFEKRIESLSKQIDKTSERADQLREKATAGRLASEESLAFEQKKEAELEKQREQERKRQQQTQAFFTVLNTYQSNVNNGDPTPVQSTIRDVAVLRQLASSLSGFYEGTDDVGKSLGKGQLPGKDGHIIRVDKSEQIWSGKDRSDVNFRTRDEIKDIVKKYDSGMFEDMMKFDKSQQFMNPSAFALNGFSDKRMVSELSEIKKGIKGIDIPKGMVDIDQVRGIITLITRKGNTVVKEKSKLFN